MPPFHPVRQVGLTVDMSHFVGEPAGSRLVRFACPHPADHQFVLLNQSGFRLRYPDLSGAPESVAAYLLLASRYVAQPGEVLTAGDRLDLFAKMGRECPEAFLHLVDENTKAFGPPSLSALSLPK